MRLLRRALVLACALASGASLALVPASEWYRGGQFAGQPSPGASEWGWYASRFPWEGSDLAPDPALRHGKLGNGVRWLVYPHAQPKGRVAVWLDVQAGSLAEKDSELGFAHIVEHMAFNGTRNYPAGSLIQFFQSNGMSFGGDTNASTSRDETVYKLNLASTDEAALRKGLSVLRDYADGLLFLPEEVKAELGVILSEKTARDSDAWRASRAFDKRFYKGTRFVNATIGEEETIRAADSEGLRAFYRRWYRADRMVVVIAGDVEPGLAQRLVREQFGSMPAACSSCEGALVPAFGTPEPQGVKAYVTPYRDSNTSVSIRVTHPRRHYPDSRAESLEVVKNGLVSLMMNRRLLRREEKDPGAWSAAQYASSIRSGNLPYAALVAVSEGKRWDAALTALHEELALAVAGGFSEEELRLAKEEFGKLLELNEKNFSAVTNTELAAQLISALNDDRVPTSPAQDVAFYAAVKDAVGLAEVNAALRAAFAPANRTIRVAGAASPAEEEVEKLWEACEKRPLQARANDDQAVFPYLETPREQPLARFAERRVPGEPSLSLHEATLPGGVRVILQPLAFEKGTVKATLLFGPGSRALPDDGNWLPKLAESALAQGGLGRLSRSDTERLLGVKGVGVSEGTLFAAQNIQGQAPREELPMLLEALRTEYLDPSVSDNEFRRLQHVLRAMRHSTFETVGGASGWMPRSFFFGGLSRFRPAEERDGTGAAELERYLKQTRRIGPVVLVISGDFDLGQASAQAARLFSDVKAGASVSRAAPLPKFPAGEEKTVVLPETTARARFNLGWSAPLSDGNDRHAFWVRKLAAAGRSARVRAEIREKLGLTYSPWCAWLRSELDAGFGFFWISVSTDPNGVAAVSDAVDRVVAAAREKGVASDELERLKRPALSNIGTSRRTQGYWQALLLSEILSGQPSMERASRDIEAIRSVKAEEVSALLAQVLGGKPARLVLATQQPQGR